ncbi:hypothetical protein BGX21_008092 [Mortierella sp. AD011]|nr:hypothetical protein BGX21_008092 [Mortierella sp. AD011]
MAPDSIDGHSSSHSKTKNSRQSSVPDTNGASSSSPAPEKESDSTESNKKAPTKRIRIPIACVNCRFKKIKCDGQSPCSHCEKFKAECVYPAATKPINHEYVEALENRLKSVESHLQGILSMGLGDPGSPPMDTFPDNAVESTLPLTGSSSRTTSIITSAVEPPSSSNVANINQGHFPSTSRVLPTSHGAANLTISLAQLTDDVTPSEEDSVFNTLQLVMGNLRVDRDGTAKYLPNFREYNERSYTDSRNNGSNASQQRLSSLSEIANLSWESVDLPRPYTLPTNILSLKATQALINIYFNSLHVMPPNRNAKA